MELSLEWQVELLLFITGFASVLHQPLALFPQLSFFHLLRLCGSSSFTSWNNDPIFFLVCLLVVQDENPYLSLPLYNALTIHILLSACESTLQGN